MSCKIKEQFEALTSGGCDDSIGLEDINKWFKEANLLGSKFTAEEIKTSFDKLKWPSLNHDQCMTFVEELANSKGMSVSELENQLGVCKLADILKTGGKGNSCSRPVKK